MYKYTVYMVYGIWLYLKPKVRLGISNSKLCGVGQVPTCFCLLFNYHSEF